MRFARIQNLDDFLVDDITHLVILLDHEPLTIADASGVLRHERVAGGVGVAHLAVDAFPALVALARFGR